MTDASKLVQDHYTHGALLERIFEFLRAEGIDPENLSHQDLFACDQIHARGIIATQEQFEHSGIRAGMRVLDIG